MPKIVLRLVCILLWIVVSLYVLISHLRQFEFDLQLFALYIGFVIMDATVYIGSAVEKDDD